MKNKLHPLFALIMFLVVATSCSPNTTPEVITTDSQSEAPPKEVILPAATHTATDALKTETPETVQMEDTPAPTEFIPTEPISEDVIYAELVSMEWQDWPVIPIVSEEMVEVYSKGIRIGTNPHAFTIFGDCQSLPEVYMGGYETGEFNIPEDQSQLIETIEWFKGSFNRESVTIKEGTTTAAILWEGWIEEEDSQCEYGETPLECEVRIHNPSIVLINLGTHWEVRNGTYLRKILEELTENGIVPIISTKADTREGDAWINEELVQIASEYHVPVWNFWRAVQELENHGMIPNDTMYLSEDGLEVQRLSSLQALDSVLRQLTVD